MANGKLFYPAIFHKADEGGFWVSFPDIPECFSEGDDMEQAYRMVTEALGLALAEREKEHDEIPSPSQIEEVEVGEDEVLVIVEFDMEAYKKKHNSKAVKKTLTLPEWLNEEAVNLGINFSQVLQEALIAKVNERG